LRLTNRGTGSPLPSLGSLAASAAPQIPTKTTAVIGRKAESAMRTLIDDINPACPWFHHRPRRRRTSFTNALS
jgi:hypothetical protein